MCRQEIVHTWTCGMPKKIRIMVFLLRFSEKMQRPFELADWSEENYGGKFRRDLFFKKIKNYAPVVREH